MALKAGAWGEECLITITEVDGTDYNYEALLETADIDLGDRDIEGIATLGGGRVVKFTPEADTTITLEGYAIEAATPDDQASGTGRGFFGHFWDAPSNDPQQISATRTRNKHRIVILWTDDTSMTSAAGALSSTSKQGLRFIAADGYITSLKPSFTDGILKFTMTMKVPPYDQNGNANIRVESTETSNTLGALNSYTSGTKW
ncbi:MAG: hypothetical protein DRO76_03535 [Candidatus Altiarchaeales archaeon]|nr:MAG: hypothetical protein DRO76_03535 [Candidatus Altiarchaeales archaeon]